MNKQIEDWKSSRDDLFEDEDRIKDFIFASATSTLKFKTCTDFSDEFQDNSVVIPKDGTGKYTLNIEGTTTTKQSKSVNLILDLIFNDLQEKRDQILNSSQISEEEEADEDEVLEVELDDNDEDEEVTSKEKNIKKIARELSKNGVYVAASNCSGLSKLTIGLHPKQVLKVSDLVANAWGIDTQMYIALTVKFNLPCLQSPDLNSIESFQCGDVSEEFNEHICSIQRARYGLDWTVCNRVLNNYFKPRIQQIKLDQREMLSTILDIMVHTIQNCPTNCVVCAQKLVHQGIKPTTCNNPLCIFSCEQYGIGVDLESTILQSPQVVDLLIVMLHASTGPENRNPILELFPRYLEATVKDETTNQIKTFNFVKDGSGEFSKEKLRVVVDLIPKISVQVEWIKQGDYKKQLSLIHPLIYKVLVWMVASNRSHLKLLKDEEIIPDLGATHQFIMMNSTPEKECRFQQLKQSYGSFYAFHGSALCHWHSILRTGLKNMSNTERMVNGAAHGSGIYLGTMSNTSIGYMRYSPCWHNSEYMRGTIGCMAVCEVANRTLYIKDHGWALVVPNEDIVQTRYFLVYQESDRHGNNGFRNNIGVDGRKLSINTIKWD
ncbi:hypothetical protein AKO1_010138 [Acrasis kona]|uniref:PARP catalytic domain-containing protein n=1 Tax=Acrasis kona TaxID=1008807 RepID=A0AAW2ZST3_9EUKA